MRLQKKSIKRAAAHTVEFAVVCPIVFMVLFGVFEYCRYIMARNVTENAIREACRFSVARTDTLQTGVDAARIETELKSYLGRMGTQLTNVVVKTYKADLYGRPTDKNGAVVASTASAAAFDETKFGDYICIEVTGDYKPCLPTFLWMSGITQIKAYAVMCSEGN